MIYVRLETAVKQRRLAKMRERERERVGGSCAYTVLLYYARACRIWREHGGLGLGSK